VADFQDRPFFQLLFKRRARLSDTLKACKERCSGLPPISCCFLFRVFRGGKEKAAQAHRC
jgi:hypothetical protein